ncbi:LLM class flavin-dependent oxidoreductase [Alkalihalobacillus oceani]|uniref:LLM class flavin-dependent oxidoreductase n=1 Tax=Halalkalibacter oceani TaxID=1653776 RepID=UPI00203BA97E|nr:LLM class flavin-dependent oxidoreductase [Halalkalibacter oceani]
MKVSILDQAPIRTGETAREALANAVRLAQHGEALGYTRYWIAEHHDFPGLACPAPEIMISAIGAQTHRIRLGAGAILLPHYRPYKVAETFHLLATLYPGRIDLGIGRAPGGSAEAAIALSGNYLQQVRELPDKLKELLHFLRHTFPDGHLYRNLNAAPVPAVPPQLWLLGTSEKSARLAAEMGMNYAFGHFMSEKDGPALLETYRQEHRRTDQEGEGHALVAVAVICAETTAEAEEIAERQLLWRLLQEKGINEGIPTSSRVRRYDYSAEDRAKIEQMKEKMIIGNPLEVRDRLRGLKEFYRTEEVMINTITDRLADRLKSYQLIAEALKI